MIKYTVGKGIGFITGVAFAMFAGLAIVGYFSIENGLTSALESVTSKKSNNGKKDETLLS